MAWNCFRIKVPDIEQDVWLLIRIRDSYTILQAQRYVHKKGILFKVQRSFSEPYYLSLNPKNGIRIIAWAPFPYKHPWTRDHKPDLDYFAKLALMQDPLGRVFSLYNYYYRHLTPDEYKEIIKKLSYDVAKVENAPLC